MTAQAWDPDDVQYLGGRLRPDIPHDLPRGLLRAHRAGGYPIPWFVAWPDGRPDFRVVDGRKRNVATRDRLCWTCGHRLRGSHVAFVVGPMCGVNRISAEPPSHIECAEYALRACPFLTDPDRGRRAKGMGDACPMPGHALQRNPGVSLLWVTKGYDVVQAPTGRPDRPGYLYAMHRPTRVEAWARGATADRGALTDAFLGGLPALVDLLRRHERPADQAAAYQYLRTDVLRATRLLDLRAGPVHAFLDAHVPPPDEA